MTVSTGFGSIGLRFNQSWVHKARRGDKPEVRELWAIKEGAAAFLTKPVQEDQFIAAVGALIGSPANSRLEQVAAAGVR